MKRFMLIALVIVQTLMLSACASSTKQPGHNLDPDSYPAQLMTPPEPTIYVDPKAEATLIDEVARMEQLRTWRLQLIGLQEWVNELYRKNKEKPQ